MKRSESVVGLGDFQTPEHLARQVLAFVRSRGVTPGRILEPTCGSGAFVSAAYATWASVREVIGIEINPAYDRELAELAKLHPSFRYEYLDAQTMDDSDLQWSSREPLLICGNLPWVTTDALSRLVHDYQLKIRDNPKKLKGLAALTGSGSFDISERLALRFVQLAVRQEKADIALLLKESVARRILLDAKDLFTDAAVVRIDSHEWFGVNVHSCLLYIHFEQGVVSANRRVEYYAGLSSESAQRWTLDGGIVRKTSRDKTRTSTASGATWRHGIKHDAASVFELDAGRTPDMRSELEHQAGLELDSPYVFPLVTARDLHVSMRLVPVRRHMLVPQRKLGDRSIERDPKALREREYLRCADERLKRRRSSIYKNKPPYAIFGVGNYTFAPFKAAVAGLYLRPHFRFLGPIDNKPIVLGDTSYFVPCERAVDAAIIVALGNEVTIMTDVQEMAFAGKRPITKRLLDSLDFQAALLVTPREALCALVVAQIAAWEGQPLPIPSEHEVLDRAASLFGNLIR